MMSKEVITIRERSDVKIVDVNTNLGSYEVVNLRNTLDALVSQNTRTILVNLSQVQHICSAAIGALVGALRRLHRQGGELKVFGLAANIKQTFDLVGVTGILTIYDAESGALNDF